METPARNGNKRQSRTASAVPSGWGSLRVPYDMYGHVPVQIEPFNTWLGFCLSNVVILCFLLSTGYILYQYGTLPFDLAAAEVAHDPEFAANAATDPPLPEIGVQFQFSNGTGVYNEGILEIAFQQRYFYRGGKGGAKKLYLGSRPCRPESAGQGLTTGRCPQWANEVEEGVVEVSETREGASLPEMQGIFNDDIYSFIQATIRIKLENNLTNEVLEELYDGEIILFSAYSRYSVSEFRWNALPEKEAEFFSQRLEVKKVLISKVDVFHTRRCIERDSHFIDFSVLEESAKDLIKSDVHVELDDSDDEGTLAKVYFRLSNIDVTVKMIPYTTLFDILGVLGGFLALLNFLLGVPGRFCNKLLFKKSLKEAVNAGEVAADVVDGSGGVRLDKSNDVVQQLTSMRSAKQARQLSRLATTATVAAVKFRNGRSLRDGTKPGSAHNHDPKRESPISENDIENNQMFAR